MDYPREPLRRGRRNGVVAALVVVGLYVGYAPLKGGVIAALDAGARAGFALASGAPAIEAGSIVRAGAAWSEAMAAARQPATAPDHSGGLLQPAYTATGALRLPPAYREWVFVGGATGLAYGEPTTIKEHWNAPGIFTHVYLEPGAYRHYLATNHRRSGRENPHCHNQQARHRQSVLWHRLSLGQPTNRRRIHTELARLRGCPRSDFG